MPVSPLNRARQTTPPVAAIRTSRERANQHRDDNGSLTERDRELIYQATGQRVRAGEPNPGWLNSLAAAIGADRTAGRLAPGQEITAVYLKDLARRYDQSAPGRNPIAGYLEPALRHLAQHGAGRLDVTA